MRKKHLASFGFLILSLSGCNDVRLQSEIVDLNTATASAAGTIDTFYSKINDAHRDLYIEQVKIIKGAKLEEVDDGQSSGSEADANVKRVVDAIVQKYFPNYQDETAPPEMLTGLTEFYTPEYIRVRSTALQGISLYVSKLNTLATSTAASEIGAAAKGAGDDLGKIANSIAAIAGGSNNKARALSTTNFSQPLSSLGNLIATTWIDFVRNNWMKDSVKETSQGFDNTVQVLIDSVEQDNEDVKVRAEKTLRLYRLYYNKESGLVNAGYDQKAKTDFCEETKKIGKIIADVDSANPKAALEKIKRAHDVLTGYVQPPQETSTSTQSNTK